MQVVHVGRSLGRLTRWLSVSAPRGAAL